MKDYHGKNRSRIYFAPQLQLVIWELNHLLFERLFRFLFFFERLGTETDGQTATGSNNRKPEICQAPLPIVKRAGSIHVFKSGQMNALQFTGSGCDLPQSVVLCCFTKPAHEAKILHTNATERGVLWSKYKENKFSTLVRQSVSQTDSSTRLKLYL